MAKAPINYEDDFTVEDETVLSRLEARDRASNVSAGDIYKTGAYAGMMLPSAGIADYFGQYPNPEKAGTLLPSFDENVNKGEYFNAAMQFLAAAGDASYTIPTIGTLTGTGLKALALGGKLSKVQLSNLMDGIGAYMTRTNDPMLAVSGGPDLNMGPSITKMESPPSSGGSNITQDLNLGSGSLFSPETKKGRRLLVLSCSDTKCPDVGDKKAIDRYLGPVFQSLKSMGIPIDVDVAIMSAKHGLIRADTPIQKYNDKMNPKKAEMFKQDADQMSRIKNTLDGYDNVIVQGGKDYKDVIRAAAGDTKITEIAGGRGIGDQRSAMKQAIAFGKIDTPVYHYSTKPGFSQFDKSKMAYDDLGPHVASTPRGSEDRFLSQVGGVRSQDGELVLKDSPFIEGDKKVFGGSIPLKADLSKPFLNPKTNKPFTESQLRDFKAAEINKILKSRGSDIPFTSNDLLFMRADGKGLSDDEVRVLIGEISQNLAKQGYTHVPYVNAFEDTGNLSYVMLVDRPKGSTKVLQGFAAKKDPAKFDDADFMMKEGGVISLKDKAVNMNRGPRGIEPFIKYMEKGGGTTTQPSVKIAPSDVDKYSKAFEVAGRFSPFTPFSKYSSLEDENFIANKEVNPELYNQQELYKSGVEFGDIETGMDLLNQTKFNPALQAGLRDVRSLSDYAQIIKEERRRPIDSAFGVYGQYNPSGNEIIVMPNSLSGDTLAHELMHKGAQYLADNFPAIKKLRQFGGEAEHRYIQSITNMAFMKRMMNEESAYLSQLFSQKNLSDRQKENIKGAVIRQNKDSLLKEVNRVIDLYYTDRNKNRLAYELKKRLDITDDMFGKIQVGDLQVDMDTVKEIFSITNEVMAKDIAASRFGKNLKRAFDKSDREQGGFDIRLLDQYLTPEAKAEGGVIGLKDRAVKMYRPMEEGGPAFSPEEEEKLRLEAAYDQLINEVIIDPITGNQRTRTEEEVLQILMQFQSPDFLQDMASAGFKLMPSVKGKGSVKTSTPFMGTLDGEPMYKDVRVNQSGGRIGFDAYTPSKDQFGAGVSVYGSKGRVKNPKELLQFGLPSSQKFGSNKINVGGIDAYYNMMNALTEGDSVRASANYSPNSKETNYNINYNAPVRDMGIPALTQGAVKMFRRMVR